MKMLVRTYRSATSTHVDICIIDIIPSCCQTNITHTRQITRALNRSAVAPVTGPQAVWLCVTHRTFLPYGSYETVKIDYVNLRLYLSERMYSYIPHTKNNLIALCEPQAVWLCVTHQTFLPHDSYEIFKIDYVNLRLYLSERKCSYVPHIKNNLLFLCSKNAKRQHAKSQSDTQSQGDVLTKIIDYLTNSLTGDTVDDERTPKQIQSDITHLLQMAHQDSQHMSRGKLETFIKKKTDDETPRSAQDDNIINKSRNPTATYVDLNNPYEISQTRKIKKRASSLLSSWPLHRKVTWKLRSQPNLPSSRSLHRNTWKLKLNTYRPHPRKIRIIAPSNMDRPYLLKEKEKLTIITMMMKSNTQDSESSSLASINYQIDDDQ